MAVIIYMLLILRTCVLFGLGSIYSNIYILIFDLDAEKDMPKL